MTVSTNHLRSVSLDARAVHTDPTPISTYQFDILVALEKDGRSRAYVWNEWEVDQLFKMRPRLIRLVPGFDDPVIDITMEGRKRLQLERG
jgi:hypothetical protein